MLVAGRELSAKPIATSLRLLRDFIPRNDTSSILSIASVSVAIPHYHVIVNEMKQSHFLSRRRDSGGFFRTSPFVSLISNPNSLIFLLPNPLSLPFEKGENQVHIPVIVGVSVAIPHSHVIANEMKQSHFLSRRRDSGGFFRTSPFVSLISNPNCFTYSLPKSPLAPLC